MKKILLATAFMFSGMAASAQNVPEELCEYFSATVGAIQLSRNVGLTQVEVVGLVEEMGLSTIVTNKLIDYTSVIYSQPIRSSEEVRAIILAQCLEIANQ